MRGRLIRGAPRFVLLAVLLLAASCGFHPLYGDAAEGASAVDDLAAIEIETIEDRVGQRMHNFLLDRLTPRGRPTRPLYLLKVTLTESVTRLAIRKDEKATRANLVLQASYVLRERRSDEALWDGVRRATSSFNILASEFATQSSERDARVRASREIADGIRSDLAIFFDLVRRGAYVRRGSGEKREKR